MKPLIDGIAAARDIAAEREPDIRIKEFLRAITIWPDASGGDNITLSIDCHFRWWHKWFLPGETAQLAEMNQDDLARTIAGWIQGALQNNLLSLSNPPSPRQIAPKRLAEMLKAETKGVGAVVTHTYDSSGRHIGSRWG